MTPTMEFTRGDGANHTCAIPTANWTSGGTLFFAAKPSPDDDNTDASAVIQGQWTDANVSDTVINGVAHKVYACHFPPSATNSILSNGAPSATYEGEFQFVPSGGGDPITAPADDNKIEVILYFDIKRETT